jgi:hypothetical protein
MMLISNNPTRRMTKGKSAALRSSRRFTAFQILVRHVTSAWLNGRTSFISWSDYGGGIGLRLGYDSGYSFCSGLLTALM